MHYWNAETFTLRRTVPVFESLEGVAVVSSSTAGDGSDVVMVACAGSRGQVRLWRCNVTESACDVVLAKEATLSALLSGGAGECTL